MSIDVPELADLEQVRGRWRRAVAGVLAKSTRKDPEQLGDAPERLLETPTYDGFAIRALYTALDELPEPPLPGEWPYRARRRRVAGRQVRAGRSPRPSRLPGCRRRGRGRERRSAGRAGRRGRRAGAAGRGIRCGARRSWGRLLEGVYLSMAPVILDAGADYPAAATCACAGGRVDADQRATLSIDLGADPLSAAAERTARADDRGRDRRGQAGRRPHRRARDHRRRARVPQPRRQRDVGARRRHRRRGGLPAACSPSRACRSARRCGRSASGSPPTTTSS